MKVKELMQKLREYNGEAEVTVVAHCRDYKFSLSYGDSDGVKKDSCESVSFYVDELNSNER